MTRPPVPPLTPEEERRVAGDACPESWEAQVERMAQVLCDTDAGDLGYTWAELMTTGEPTPNSGIAEAYRRLARAALAAMPPVVPAMLALAEELREHVGHAAQEAREWEGDPHRVAEWEGQQSAYHWARHLLLATLSAAVTGEQPR